MVSIPFFSKKTQKILDSNKDRIFLLTQQQQDEIISRTKLHEDHENYIDPALLTEQVISENVELKVLFDENQIEIGKKIRHGKDTVVEIGKGYWIFHTNVKVLKDSRIRITRKWEASISNETTFTGKIPGFFTNKQFRCWFVEAEGEYTYDPRDQTPIDIKRQNEGLLEIGHLAAKKNLGAALIEDLGSKVKKWWEALGNQIIMLTLSFFFLLFIGMFFGQYEFTKPAGA